jgi:hypothetical protein
LFIAEHLSIRRLEQRRRTESSEKNRTEKMICLARESLDKEIAEHRKTSRLPANFKLDDTQYYEQLRQIRSYTDRLSYLKSLVTVINTPPTFAVPMDEGGPHRGFLTPYRVLRQPDLVDMSAWNYLKAHRLGEHLFLNCKDIPIIPLAQLVIEMRAKFNLLNEPWWPILVGISKQMHQELIDVLQTKHQLHGSHVYAWETQEKLLNRQTLTLICANRGETIYEIDPNETYLVQIDADTKQCCLGAAPENSDQTYKKVVKLESRIK